MTASCSHSQFNADGKRSGNYRSMHPPRPTHEQQCYRRYKRESRIRRTGGVRKRVEGRWPRETGCVIPLDLFGYGSSEGFLEPDLTRVALCCGAH